MVRRQVAESKGGVMSEPRLAGEGRHPDGTAYAPNETAGYRHTGVGVIPEDWEVRSLRSNLAEPPSYGINAPAVPFDGSLPTYIRITDIGKNGRFRPIPRVSVNGADATRHFLRPGDLVFARTGASVGKSYLYDRRDGPLVFAGFLIRVNPDPTRLQPAFIAYYVQTRRYWDWIANNSARSGQPGINSNEYGSLPVPVPPVAEQRAIAAVLSDVDELIGSLEALVAKKRDIKQAAMQQLLTGRTRLPGFGGEWRTGRLGDLGTLSKGRGIRRDELGETGARCVRYGELYTRYEHYVVKPVSRIPQHVADAALPIMQGDLLFAGSGETAEEIGICVAYIGEEPAYAGGDIIVLRSSGQDAVYLAHVLNSPPAIRQKARTAQGDAVVHIRGHHLAEVELPLPPLPEQQAIAAVLCDMDGEIVALEHRLDKTRAIKQGMMQQLLTGSIRLPIPDDDKEGHTHEA